MSGLYDERFSTKALFDPLGCHILGAPVKKLAIVALLVFAGCRRQVQVTSVPTASAANANAPGAATPREAVQLFLATAKAQDLQAMSNIWGSAAGPARTSAVMSAAELEQRQIVLMRCLRHDSYAILHESPAKGGERVFTVELRKGTLTPRANFTTALGPENRWYLREFQLEALNSICTSR